MESLSRILQARSGSRLFSLIMVLTICSNFFRASVANPAGYDDADEQLTQLASKVDTIEDKLDTLSDSVNIKLDILLNQAGETTGENSSDNGGRDEAGSDSSSEAESTGSADTPPLQVLSVARSLAPDGNTFRVRFTKTIGRDDLSAQLFGQNNDFQDADTLEEEGDGVWLATFTCRVSDNVIMHPWIMLGDKIDYMVGFEVNTNPSSRAFQDSVQVPALNVATARELVYEPGQDVVVQVSVAKTGNIDEPSVQIRESFAGVDLDTGEYHFEFEHVDLVTSSPMEEFPDSLNQSFSVLTSNNHVSGILQLSTSLSADDIEMSLIRDVMVLRHIEIYPSNQTGYLPEGYLSVLNIPYLERSEDGNMLFPCEVGTECTPRCYAVGEKISDMRVFRIMPSQLLEQEPNQRTAQYMESFLAVFWTLELEEDSGNSAGIIPFQCVAYDSRNRRTVSRFVDVQAVIPSSIDHERSSFQVQDDPTDALKKRVTLRCAVKGRPLPTITFENGSSMAVLPSAGDPPDLVTPIDGHAVIATKVITVDAADLDAVEAVDDITGIDLALQVHELRPACTIFGVSTGTFDMHTFEIRDSD